MKKTSLKLSLTGLVMFVVLAIGASTASAAQTTTTKTTTLNGGVIKVVVAKTTTTSNSRATTHSYRPLPQQARHTPHHSKWKKSKRGKHGKHGKYGHHMNRGRAHAEPVLVKRTTYQPGRAPVVTYVKAQPDRRGRR